MASFLESALSAFKFFLAGFTIFAGIITMFGPLTPLDGALGFLYSTRLGLMAFGFICVSCGLTLLYGKMRRSRKWTGIGLMAVYLCFTFGALLQFLAFGEVLSWLPGAVLAVISGLLWLRWKFKTEYINKYHFVDDIVELRRLEHGNEGRVSS